MKLRLKKTLSSSSRPKSRGFSLIELMFAIVIIGVIGIMLTSFMRDSSRSMLWSVNKSMITNDFRQFTQQIGNDAINADYVFLYSNFAVDNHNDRDDRVQSPFSGDFLVFVETGPFPNVASPRFYESITVYFREPGTDANRPAFRSRVDFPQGVNPAGFDLVNADFETLLTSQRNAIIDNATEVLQLVQGLTGNRLFRRINNGQAFLVNGEIIHGTNAQQVTNTYNLTISTRSLL